MEAFIKKGILSYTDIKGNVITKIDLSNCIRPQILYGKKILILNFWDEKDKEYVSVYINYKDKTILKCKSISYQLLDTETGIIDLESKEILLEILCEDITPIRNSDTLFLIQKQMKLF